jgi:hypothetical protein
MFFCFGRLGDMLFEVHANRVLSDYGGAVARDQCRDRVRARCRDECRPFVLLDWHLPGDVVDSELGELLADAV